MAISQLSIPVRTAGAGTTYPADITLISAKINEIAFAMNISPLTISAAVGLGDPAADVNLIVAKVNEIIGQTNAGTGTTQPGTTQPAATKATAPYFGTIDDVNNIVTLGSNYAFTEVRWGVEGQGAQALASNSVCSPGNIAGRLYAYVTADAASNRLQSDTVYSAAFSLAAVSPVNNAPTVTLSSPQAGQSLTTGDPVVLNANPQDADGASDIRKVEYLDNGVKFTETTVAPHTVQTNISAGSHSFTARVYDMVGASALSGAVVVQAAAAGSGGTGGTGKATQRYVGDSNTEGNRVDGPPYPVIVRNALNQSTFPPSEFINAGHSGESPDKLLTRLQAEIIDKNKTGTNGITQDISVYVAGVNAARVGDDYSLHFGLFQTPEEIAHDILESGRLERLSGIRPMLVSSFYDRQAFYSGDPTEDARRVAVIEAVNNILAANWQKYGFLLFRDLRNGLLSPTAPLPAANGGLAGTKWQTDGIHITNAGHADLAAIILQDIQTIYAMVVPAFANPGEYKYSNEWVAISNVSVSGNVITTTGTNTTFSSAARSISRIPYTNVTTRLGRRTFGNSTGQDKTFGVTSKRTLGGAWTEQDYVFYTSTTNTGIVRVFFQGAKRYELTSFALGYLFHVDVYADHIEFILDKGDGNGEASVWSEPRYETVDLFASIGMSAVAGVTTSITSAPAVTTPVVAYPNGIRPLNPINGSFILQTSAFIKDAAAGDVFNAKVQSREAFGAVASGSVGRLEWKSAGTDVTGISGAPNNSPGPSNILAGIHNEKDGSGVPSVRKYGAVAGAGNWHQYSGTPEFSTVVTVNAGNSALVDISYRMDGVEFDSSVGVSIPFPCRFDTEILTAGSKVYNIRLFATNPTV